MKAFRNPTSEMPVRPPASASCPYHTVQRSSISEVNGCYTRDAARPVVEESASPFKQWALHLTG